MTRGLLSIVLILSLGLSSLGFGMARGQAPTAGKMVICTGNGIVTISIDADGNPVESHTLCPDAALSFWAAVTAPPLAAAPVQLASARLDWPQDAVVTRPGHPRTRSARAPPA